MEGHRLGNHICDHGEARYLALLVRGLRPMWDAQMGPSSRVVGTCLTVTAAFWHCRIVETHRELNRLQAAVC